jgi:hypothetical protein
MRISPHATRASRVVAILLALLLGVAGHSDAGDPDPGCPGVNRVTCGLETYDVWTPTFDVECHSAIGFGSASYDYPAGTIDLTAYTIPPVGVHLVDAFTFHGPSPGTPVTFGLRVHYDVLVGSTSLGHLYLLPFNEEPADEPQLIMFPASNHSVGTLVMTLTRPAGAPVGLEIEASMSGGGMDSANGTFIFDFVLPPGVSVTSCNGYVQDAPVPARPASWGEVKAAYR